ncbi:hypothetical protein SCF23_16210 [Methanospirillum hungatei]|nr:hypothetical protein [Methanospirillum hungatei]
MNDYAHKKSLVFSIYPTLGGPIEIKKIHIIIDGQKPFNSYDSTDVGLNVAEYYNITNESG